MKTLITLATLAIAGTTLVGCQSGQKSKSTQPISPERLNSLRAEFQQADAGARIGSVDEVLEKEMLAKVGQVTAADFPDGTAVAIIDSNKQVVAVGTVIKTFDSAVHVKYEKRGTRPPMVGDAAVKMTEKF